MFQLITPTSGVPTVRIPAASGPADSQTVSSLTRTEAAPSGTRITKRLVSVGMRIMRPRFASALEGVRTTDHFTGFQITGSLDEGRLAATLERLPEGLTEFMCHPGICGEELRAARTRLRESRERELRALTSPEVREALVESNVELRTFDSL